MSDMKKTAIIAVVGIFGFWILTKTLNMLAQNPGASSYESHCAKCHGSQGEGIGRLVPPLANTDWLEQNHEQIPCIIQNGLKDSILINGVWYFEEMLPHADLNEIQITNITNYITKTFTKEKKFYLEQEVESLLDTCE